MNKFLEAIANVFRVPDLRNRILFTLALLAVYRLGAFVPTPGVNTVALQDFFEQNRGSVFGMLSLFSGGMLERLTIFALGIMPTSRRRLFFSCSRWSCRRSKSFRKKGAWAAKDHSVDALPYDHPFPLCSPSVSPSRCRRATAISC